MKITRRSDKGKGGHLLISVPASRVAEIEAALTFLEGNGVRHRCEQMSSTIYHFLCLSFGVSAAGRRAGQHLTTPPSQGRAGASLNWRASAPR
jgi:hypothetical protein